MKGYLNNLTQRTLNTGNRVEPHLPSMFESHQERIVPYEEEITLVASAAAPPRIKGEKTIVESQSPQHAPTASNSEVEAEEAAIPKSWRFETEAAEELVLESSSRPLESLSRDVKPEEHVEVSTPTSQQLESFETIEASSSSFEREPQITRMKTDHSFNLSA